MSLTTAAIHITPHFKLDIPADAPWQLHDPFLRNRPYFLMLFARTPAGGHCYDVFFNHDVAADWQEYVQEQVPAGLGDYISYPEWCGVSPHRFDAQLVWC